MLHPRGRWMYSNKVASDLRKRLESAAYPDLGAMMEGYARAAAELDCLPLSECRTILEALTERVVNRNA